MSPFTHGLLSWALADRVLPSQRDVALVTLGGLVSDLDSAGIVLDLANGALGRSPTDYYAALHHFLLHGAAGGLLVATLLAVPAQEKGKVWLGAFLTFHLHLLCDLVGSRGPMAGEGVWPIYYLGPFTNQSGVMLWHGQWPLNGWQNVSLTLALLGWALYVAWRWDRSIFLPWAPGVHRELVAALRGRFGIPQGESAGSKSDAP